VRRATGAAAAIATSLMFAPGADAAFPGRDGLIAFTRSVFPDSAQIYVVRPNGRGLRPITHRRRGAIAPAWSPGGKRIAFTAPGRLSPMHVFVKRLGGGVRQLTQYASSSRAATCISSIPHGRLTADRSRS